MLDVTRLAVDKQPDVVAQTDPSWPKNARVHLHLSYGMSVLALLAFGVWYGITAWHTMKQATLMRFSLLSEITANTADSTFEHYQSTLKLLGQELHYTHAWNQPRRALGTLQRFQKILPGVVSVNLLRPNGQVVASTAISSTHQLPTFRVSRPLWLGLQRAEVEYGLAVARPTYGPLIHHWVIPLRYAVRKPSGAVRFMLTAPLRLRHQESQWRHLPLAHVPLAGLMIGLIRDDGYLEEVWPVPRQFDFKTLYARAPTGALVRALRTHVQTGQGHFEGNMGFRSVQVLGTYRRLAHYPMTAFVAAPVPAIIGVWWHRTRIPFALIALMLGVSGGFYLWILSREQAADTRQMKAIARLAYQARYDSLTGLLNRHGLQDTLEREHARAESGHQPYCLLLVDLDYLKLINDGYGHDVGDQMLVQIADTLSVTLGPGNWVGRWGGDELLCILPGIEATAGSLAAEQLRGRVRELRGNAQGRSIPYSVSIGLASYPQDGDRFEILLTHIDSALYQAKNRGRDQVVIAGEEASGVFFIGHQIDEALAQGTLQPAYQSIVDLPSGQVVAEEALARIRLPDGTLMVAGQFIAAASRLQIVHRVDHAIIQQVIGHCVAQTIAGASPRLHFVNLSASLLHHPQEVADILEAARRGCEACNAPPDQGRPLVIEVTEREFLEDSQEALRILQPLLHFGLRLAVDDFGSGYSSFLYLADLPVSFLKIEMALVQRARHEDRVLAMVKGIQGIAKDLGLTTIAEGIEDEETLDQMREIGVNWGQGHYFGYPVISGD